MESRAQILAEITGIFLSLQEITKNSTNKSINQLKEDLTTKLTTIDHLLQRSDKLNQSALQETSNELYQAIAERSIHLESQFNESLDGRLTKEITKVSNILSENVAQTKEELERTIETRTTTLDQTLTETLADTRTLIETIERNTSTALETIASNVASLTNNDRLIDSALERIDETVARSNNNHEILAEALSTLHETTNAALERIRTIVAQKDAEIESLATMLRTTDARSTTHDGALDSLRHAVDAEMLTINNRLMEFDTLAEQVQSLERIEQPTIDLDGLSKTITENVRRSIPPQQPPQVPSVETIAQKVLESIDLPQNGRDAHEWTIQPHPTQKGTIVAKRADQDDWKVIYRAPVVDHSNAGGGGISSQRAAIVARTVFQEEFGGNGGSIDLNLTFIGNVPNRTKTYKVLGIAYTDSDGRFQFDFDQTGIETIYNVEADAEMLPSDELAPQERLISCFIESTDNHSIVGYGFSYQRSNAGLDDQDIFTKVIAPPGILVRITVEGV